MENKDSGSSGEAAGDVARNRKQQFRFDANTDELLAREVLANNPFEAEHGAVGQAWENVAVAVNVSARSSSIVDGRRCRERLKILVKNRKAAVAATERASGIEEEVSEHDRLLDEIIEFQESSAALAADRKQERQETADKGERQGEEIRQLAMEGMKQREKKRVSSDAEVVALLRDRSEAAREGKRQKLELEARRLALEERRTELAEKKAQLEAQERVAMIGLLAGLAAKFQAPQQ